MLKPFQRAVVWRADTRAAWYCTLALVAVPLMVQLPILLGWLDIDPFAMLGQTTASSRPGLLPGLPWIDPNVGWITQPLGHLAAEQWLSGHVPWWNPYNGFGMPLAASMQPAAFFLPFVLVLHFVAHGFVLLRIELQVVAGLGTYALMRTLGFRRATALTAGCLFQLGGAFAWFAHAPYMPIPFLPLLLLGVERVRAARLGSGIWAVAAGIAFSLYAGFPETAFLDGLLGLAWMLVRCAGLRPMAQRRFLAGVAAGGAAGLLLAAPIVWPFLDFLRHADSGSHSGYASELTLPAAAVPMLLLPYIYGPIQGVAQSKESLLTVWIIGGYFGFLPLVLAGLASIRGAGLVGLRRLCVGWIVVCLLKMVQLPGIATLVDLVPGIPMVAFERFIVPSMTMACVFLAACAIEDWRNAGRRSDIQAACVIGVVLLGAAMVGSAPHRDLVAVAGRPYAWTSIGGAAAALAGLLCLLAGAPTRGRVAALSALLVGEACLLFVVPSFSGIRGVVGDREPLTFLQSRLGLDRFYTLGPIQPNFSAMSGLASINYDMLPVDSGLVAYVRKHLDRYADFILFTGENHRTDPSLPDPQSELAAHLAAYQTVGVRYVLTPPGGGPWAALEQPVSDLRSGSRLLPLPLRSGESARGDLIVPPSGGVLARVRVRLGTYGGLSDGRLRVTMCAGGGGAPSCAAGTIDLATARDNQPAAVLLDRELDVPGGQKIAFRLTHVDGRHDVALFLGDSAAGLELEGPGPSRVGKAVDLAALFAPPAGGQVPRVVMSSASSDIYEVPGAATYFEAEAGCHVTARTRETALTDCSVPTRLTRREMYDPGWHATVNGGIVGIERVGEVFQSVAVPSGRADVRFYYEPPGMVWARLAFCAGVLGLIAASAWSVRRAASSGPAARRDTARNRTRDSRRRARAA